MLFKAYKELEARQRFQSACGDAPSDAFWRVRFRALRAPAASALHKGGWVSTFAAVAYNLSADAESAVTSGSIRLHRDPFRMASTVRVGTCFIISILDRSRPSETDPDVSDWNRVTADSASAPRLYATAANVNTQPPLCNAEAAGSRRALNRTRQSASDGASPRAD